jgi:hypothetical protein
LGALIFSAITVLSAAIGTAVAVLRVFGVITPNDDVTAFVDFTGWLHATPLIMIGLTVLSIALFIFIKPGQTLKAALAV